MFLKTPCLNVLLAFVNTYRIDEMTIFVHYGCPSNIKILVSILHTIFSKYSI